MDGWLNQASVSLSIIWVESDGIWFHSSSACKNNKLWIDGWMDGWMEMTEMHFVTFPQPVVADITRSHTQLTLLASFKAFVLFANLSACPVSPSIKRQATLTKCYNLN